MPTDLDEKALDKKPKISQLVDDCIEFEGNRGLAKKTAGKDGLLTCNEHRTLNSIAI